MAEDCVNGYASALRFRDSRESESTVSALLTDSTMRGFAISFSTSRRVTAQDFFFFLGIRSSCHGVESQERSIQTRQVDSGDTFSVS